MRTTFQLDDSYALVAGESHFDLHNHFDFVGFEYRSSEKKARLEWQRGIEEWVPKTLPNRLALVFEGVTNLVVQRRDDYLPFSEDSCVASISFLPPALADRFDTPCPGHRSDDEHLSIQFQSGAGIKIWADSATCESLPG